MDRERWSLLIGFVVAVVLGVLVSYSAELVLIFCGIDCSR